MNNIEGDIAILGGGIVGLATAYKMQLRYPHLNLIIIEKETDLAFHQTGKNSGVIHSGLYYKPGSYRAKNCVDGRKQLIDFAKKYNINHDVCGKIVLAINSLEADRLVELKRNGEENGLVGLRLLDQQELKEIEPFAEGVAALFVPESGIIDYSAVTNKFAELIQDINPNSVILTNCEVYDIQKNIMFSTTGQIISKHIVFCGGLFSDRLALKDKLKLNMRIVGFRGDYYKLKDNIVSKVNHLIYPVPNPEFPFLGVHLTRMINGGVECGPNAVFTFKREGYSRLSFNLRDTWESLSFIGTWKLFINHWKFGLKEYRRAFIKRLFLKELRRMIPSLKMSDIEFKRSGVRAMALGVDGEVIDDFLILENDNNIQVLNAP